MKTLSIVIPALNEEKGIGPVLDEIPLQRLSDMGYKVELLVIDNNSEDDTANIARQHGATVIIQPMRGYGNVYKAGFAYAKGDVIATGDADLTYPFQILPDILARMEKDGIEFMNTDRLTSLKPGVMSWSHQLGNYILTFLCWLLYGWPFRDSQSGMWIFKRNIWPTLQVTSSGMPFSQELKLETYLKGYICAEVPIQYRARKGMEKLNTIRDGIGNILHLFQKRFSLHTSEV